MDAGTARHDFLPPKIEPAVQAEKAGLYRRRPGASTQVENTDRLWNLEDDQLAQSLQAFTNLMTEPSGLRYVKRRWHEVRGDHTDSWGHSWWYFEIDPTGKVIRQIEEYENGTTLGYDSRTPAEEFGQLSVEPLDQALVGFDFTTAADFDDRWERRTNR